LLTFRERGPDEPGTAANRDDSGWPLAILPGTAVVTACPGLAAYESRYEPATMPGFTAGGHAGGQPAISGQIRGPDERARSGRGGGRGRQPGTGEPVQPILGDQCGLMGKIVATVHRI
jgi:hypothetical protein